MKLDRIFFTEVNKIAIDNDQATRKLRQRSKCIVDYKSAIVYFNHVRCRACEDIIPPATLEAHHTLTSRPPSYRRHGWKHIILHQAGHLFVAGSGRGYIWAGNKTKKFLDIQTLFSTKL